MNGEVRKGNGVRVALTRRFDGVQTQVQGEPGGPRVPQIGDLPNRATQNIPLIELLAQLNPGRILVNLGVRKKIT